MRVYYMLRNVYYILRDACYILRVLRACAVSILRAQRMCPRRQYAA